LLALALLVGALLPGIASAKSAEQPPLTLLVVPFRLAGDSVAGNEWIPAAFTQGVSLVVRRWGHRVEDLAGAFPDVDPAAPDAAALRAWLAQQKPAADQVLLGWIGIDREQVTIRMATIGGPSTELRSRRIGGHVNRLPSLLLKVTDALAEDAALEVPGELQDAVRKEFTASAEAFRLFGRAAASTDAAQAVDLLGAAVKADPGFAAAWMQYGLGLFRLGREDEAVEAFRGVLKRSAGFKEAYNNLGVILSNRGQVEDAVRLFREALSIDGRYFDARFNLAKLLDREKRNQEAFAEYGTLVTAAPDRNDIRFRYALLADRTGAPAKALEQFRIISPKAPDLAEDFFMQKGREARQDARFKDAEAFFQRAMDINPRLYDALRELGTTHFLAGDFKRSTDLFVQAADRMPASAEVRHYLGLSLVREGRPADALPSFLKAVELGNLKESYLEIGRIHLAEGRFPDAIASINRYLKGKPDDPEALELLSEISRKARDEAEQMQKKSDFAIRRLDKMEEIVRDLDRKNADLQARYDQTRSEADGCQRENKSLRDRAASLEAELSLRVQESGEHLKTLGQRLGELQSFQDVRLSTLEKDLAAERQARREAEQRLERYLTQIQSEGKVTLLQGVPVAEVERIRAELKEREGSLSALRQEFDTARAEVARLEAGLEAASREHQRALGVVLGGRIELDAEVDALRAEYRRGMEACREEGASAREGLAACQDGFRQVYAREAACVGDLAAARGELAAAVALQEGDLTAYREEQRRGADRISELSRSLEDAKADVVRLSRDLAEAREALRRSLEERERDLADLEALRRKDGAPGEGGRP
jgi:tetratricopeptide (TPR) repeat protein